MKWRKRQKDKLRTVELRETRIRKTRIREAIIRKARIRKTRIRRVGIRKVRIQKASNIRKELEFNMKKNCKLIATLPSFNRLSKVEEVFENPAISEVRFNTGVQTFYSPKQVVEYLKKLSQRYQKRVWIDIKGRQLRITKWADPQFSCIELNHKIQLKGNTKIYFRNGGVSQVVHVVNGNQIYVDPIPYEALGAGQSVNLVAENSIGMNNEVIVDGYLTELDKQYLSACQKYEINSIMASFVEKEEDIIEITSILPQAEIIAKIESLAGIQFALRRIFPLPKISNIMVARDDLFLQLGQGNKMIPYLRDLIHVAPKAICASRIFSSLEYRITPDFADFEDLEFMYQMGYRTFLLSDNICNYKLKEAIEAWRVFQNG